MNTDDKLDALNEKLDGLHSLVVEMRADIKTRDTLCLASHRVIDSRLDGLHKKIEGNGKPGIVGEMSSLKDAFTTLREAFATLKTEINTRTAIYSGIGVFVGGALVTIAAAIIGKL